MGAEPRSRSAASALTCAVPRGGRGVPRAAPGPRPAAEGRGLLAHPCALRGVRPDYRAGASGGWAARSRPSRVEGGADPAGTQIPEGAKPAEREVSLQGFAQVLTSAPAPPTTRAPHRPGVFGE